MKSAPFAYRSAPTLDAALALLAEHDDALPISGGQSLAPLLNLRMAMCDTLVDLGRIAELRETRDLGDGIFLGAGVTHAMIEDGVAPDPANGLMRNAAAHIAYRAVRCHGTLGGSVAMADPAADWPCVLLALDAVAIARGPRGERRVAMDDLLIAAYETSLAHGEILVGFEIPKLAADAGTGRVKFNKKAGAFAMSLAVAVRNGARTRVALGAAGPRARLLPRAARALAERAPRETWSALLRDEIAAAMDAPDDYALNLHAACVERAMAEALA